MSQPPFVGASADGREPRPGTRLGIVRQIEPFDASFLFVRNHRLDPAAITTSVAIPVLDQRQMLEWSRHRDDSPEGPWSKSSSTTKFDDTLNISLDPNARILAASNQGFKTLVFICFWASWVVVNRSRKVNRLG
jgi:hypothetical protein